MLALGLSASRGALGETEKPSTALARAERGGEGGVVVGAEPVGLGEQHVDSRSRQRRVRSAASVSVASIERGHGHWPSRASEASSISTTRTGLSAPARGMQALVEVEAHVADGRNRQRIGEPEQRQQRHQHEAQNVGSSLRVSMGRFSRARAIWRAPF